MASDAGIKPTSASCNGLEKHIPRRKIMAVALYARVSTHRQQQAQTIEQQIERLQTHAADQGWEIAAEHIFRDDGYSGSRLNRPGLDHLRDQASLALFDRVLITAPDRLARNFVHQMVILEELEQHGCVVEFLDRPMSDDPHDQLVLQIRGAVAEYEQTLIRERMRRGKLRKMQTGQLLPWSRKPYGYLLDAEHPGDPTGVRIDEGEAAIVRQLFAWYTDPQERPSLYELAKRLFQQGILTPRGGTYWYDSTLHNILTNPAYMGMACYNRRHNVPATQRNAALRPVGPGVTRRSNLPEEWMPIPVPAIVSPKQFAQAQERLALNQRLASRNNTQQEYLLRALISCGACRRSCSGRGDKRRLYRYYVCNTKRAPHLRAQGICCPTRHNAPTKKLDELVWQDLCAVIRHPENTVRALQRAQSGQWLPQSLQAQRQTLRQTLAHLSRQETRLLDVYLGEVIDRAEFERKRAEIHQKKRALQLQQRQLDAQTNQQRALADMATSIEVFCRQIEQGLDQATFAQKRQRVELLIDRVLVNDDQVEIHYVIPTSEEGTQTRFCHLRSDHTGGGVGGECFRELSDASQISREIRLWN